MTHYSYIYIPELTANIVQDDLSLNKVAVYSDAEPEQQRQHNTERRDCSIRRETGGATYKRGGATYKRGGKTYKHGGETYKRGGKLFMNYYQDILMFYLKVLFTGFT